MRLVPRQSEMCAIKDGADSIRLHVLGQTASLAFGWCSKGGTGLCLAVLPRAVEADSCCITMTAALQCLSLCFITFFVYCPNRVLVQVLCSACLPSERGRRTGAGMWCRLCEAGSLPLCPPAVTQAPRQPCW